MDSIWTRDCPMPARPPLTGEVQADAAVIGGGMAGVLTAYFLHKQGLRTVLLEAGTVGGGQTGGTTAKITAGHGLRYARLADDWGWDAARRYADAMSRAVEAYARVVEYENIDCAFTRCPNYVYSSVDSALMRREAEAAARVGLDAHFTKETELPFAVAGAVRLENQARFHPLRFLRAVSAPLTVYEHSRVTEVSDGRLRTEGGAITARHIVFATHYPFVNRPGYYFLRMHQERSYVLAVEGAPVLEGMYWGADEGGLSLRPAEGLLLLGGAGHRTGENRAGGSYDSLRRSANRYWPDAIPRAHWSAQDCMPMDGLPYIGRYAADTPGWYVATGFQKWGMTGAMAAATRICGMILGRDTSETELFSPGRFALSPSADAMLADGLESARGLARPWFEPPRALLDALPEGHGGIVEHEGHKAAVSKTREGGTFVHSCRCPHLGCQVEWNPDDRTWECPCHGSRFAEGGAVLDGPAQTALRER